MSEIVITIAYVNYWKDPNNDDYFTKFIEYNFGNVKLVNYTDNPHILIASCMGNINIIKTIDASCKIFYYGEILNRYPPYNNYNLLQNTFDLIVGFNKTDLNKKQIRFPLWLIYYKYYKFDEYDNILTHIQKKYLENLNVKKTIFASIISRHDRGGQRTKIYNELSKYGQIKSPGTFRNNTPRIGTSLENKITFISSSVYNICPENAVYEEYCTEKIFQAFEGGTIPLYWGITNPESEIINENKYCFCNIDNNELLKCDINNVVEHKDKFIEGEIFKKNAGSIINNFYETLYTNIKIKCGL